MIRLIALFVAIEQGVVYNALVSEFMTKHHIMKSMRHEGVEPSAREPESHVLSITLTAPNKLILQ
jgi:hypothetical protein